MNARRVTAAFAVVLSLALAGCTADEPTTAPAITVEDAWVKAADAGEMTALFGEIHNPSDADVTLVSAASEASSELQLHETGMGSDGSMTMSEVDGGLPIAAGETRSLEPGGDHVMFMGLDASLIPGEEVTVSLTFDDGSVIDVTAPIKDASGAEEEYSSGDHAEH